MTRPVWMVTGARGLLGRHLENRLTDEPLLSLGRRTLDVTDSEAVRTAVARHRPDIVVNCAAWTATEAAEHHALDAWHINAEGPRHLAQACARTGAVLLHVSTDYVFSGTARTPYSESAATDPLNVYGCTKAAGERTVLEALPTGYVVRTAWMYGAGGKSFVRTMTDLERTEATVDVVNDQWGQPTWAGDLAGQLVRLGRAAHRGTAPPGIYHGTNSGFTSWYGLACETFRLLGADPARVRPITTQELGRPVSRPAYSVLGHDRWPLAGIAPLRSWRQALHASFPSLLTETSGSEERI